MEDPTPHQNDFALVLISRGYVKATAKGDDHTQVVSRVNTALPFDENARYNFPVRDASGLGGTKGPWGTGEEADSQVQLSYYIDHTTGFESLRGASRWATGDTVSGDFAIPRWWLFDAIYFSSLDGKLNFWDAEVLPLWNAKSVTDSGSGESKSTTKANAASLASIDPTATASLHSGRFEVAVTYLQDGVTKAAKAYEAHTIPGGLTAVFWFFSPENMEVAVKLLGPDIEHHWWAFVASLSSMEYTLTVKDTKTSAVWTYTNPKDNLLGHADFKALSDS